MSFQNYTPRNILITGGAGFIGANFVKFYLSLDAHARIINLDNLTYAGSLDNLKNLPDPTRHYFIRGDISDATLVSTLLREYQIDTIVHFAAESHVDRSIQGPSAFVQTNVVGTFVLLDAARQFWIDEKKWDNNQCRFHHISTDEVYGSLSKTDPPFTEKTAYAPNSPYSASKAGSDHLVRAYYHTYGLPVTMSNCSNNYGPFQHTEKFIPTVIRKCLKWESIPVYGDGSNIRDWLFVEDHCHGIAKIISRGKVGEAYNLGGEHEIDNMSLALQICRAMDELKPRNKSYSSLITLVTDRPGHDWRYAIDITKISKELGWYPTTSFTDGLIKTIDFYTKSFDMSNLSTVI